MKNSFFAFVFRQKYITRWSLMRNVIPESLSDHTAQTAVLAHALAVIGNTYFGKHYDADRFSVLALYHDLPEVLTGDLPTPVKYSGSEIKRGYDALEKEAISRLVSSLPEELRGVYAPILNEKEWSEDEYKLVKAADRLSAYLKCIEEAKCGNTEFRSAENATLERLHGMECEELEYYLKELLPAFRLSLDELEI